MRHLLLLLALLALPAMAQQPPPKLEPVEPPPPAGPVTALNEEEVASLPVVIRRGDKAESYMSAEGQRIVRVTQPGGRVYYLVEQQPGYSGPAGTDPSDSRLRAAQWLIHEW
jgi:hypothetical protein